MHPPIAGPVRRGLVAASVLLLAACAARGPGPIYEYRASPSPLTYRITGATANEIETPGGVQQQEVTSEATVSLTMGDEVAAGRSYSVTIESFAGKLVSDFGDQELGGEGLAGSTFRAVLAPDGAVEVTEAPEIDVEGVTVDDLVDLIAAVVFPLPPGGDPGATEWPHRTVTPVGSKMKGATTYEGTARFAGDTVWQGIAARVIVSQGTFVARGSGMPEGAPAEVELTLEGTSANRYVWDPASGVLLAAASDGEGKGEIATMGFTMPMVIESRGTIELVR